MNILSVITVLISLACTYALEDLGYCGFDCSTRSGYPKNVNELRPADIKVVGALGDAYVAATGAGATNSEQLKIDYRGLSGSIGGDKCLEEHITIPNILKKFNPRLFGQSYGTGPVSDWYHAQLNVAVADAKAADLFGQAKELVRRMLEHPDKVDFKRDWKFIYIYVGVNDACYYCKVGPVEGIKSNPCSYKAYFEQAVKYLYDNLPRAIVNIVSVLNVQAFAAIDKLSPACKAIHEKTCACATPQTLADPAKLSRDYQKAVLEIQNEGKYEKEDFTVVVQPTFENIFQPPLLKNGSLNTGYYSPDCTHGSPYGHALIAKLVWNNILQPVGSKVSNYSLSDPNIPLLCPKWSCPYIRTKKNSVNCTRPIYKHKHHHYYDYSRSHEDCGDRRTEYYDEGKGFVSK